MTEDVARNILAEPTLEAIAAVEDIPNEPVEVPEWGMVVYMWGLTGAERDAFEAETVRPSKKKGEDPGLDLRNVRARLVARCMRNARGERIVPDDQAELLGRKSAVVLTRLFKVAQRLSGMGEEAAAEAEGNSEPGPAAG